MKYNETTDRSSQTYSRSTERMNTCDIGGKGEKSRRVDGFDGVIGGLGKRVQGSTLLCYFIERQFRFAPKLFYHFHRDEACRLKSIKVRAG